MRCSPSVLVRLSLLPALFGAACLTQPTALPSDGGTAGTGGDAGGRGAGMGTGTGPRTDTGAGTGACNPDAAVPLSTLEAANTADSTADITYLDDLGKHPGCSTAGLSARTNLDGTPASYTPAVIPGYPCAAKEYKPASGDDPSKNIVVLVHGNSSTPTDWETYVNDTAKTPMIRRRSWPTATTSTRRTSATTWSEATPRTPTTPRTTRPRTTTTGGPSPSSRASSPTSSCCTRRLASST